MTESIIRRRAAALIRELSAKKLKVAVDFLTYLRAKEDWDATLEILEDPALSRSLKRGQRDLKAGRWSRWQDVKRRV
jgi:hypothetical protein